jgi:Lysylphosphatidylglycerol synthase TM region
MKIAKILMTALGIYLLVHLIVTIGPAVLTTELTTLGWSLAILAALGLVKLGLRTWSWREALAADGIQTTGWQLFGARLISQTFGYLSAMGSLVADPLKPLLLKDTVDVAASTPGTLVETAVFWFTSLLLILAGAFAGILLASSGPQLPAVMLATAAIVVGGFVFLLTKAPLVPRLRGFLARKWKGHPACLTAWLIKAEGIEEPTISFHRRHPRALRHILLLNLAVQIVMGIEVLVVVAAIGVKIGFLQLLATEGATRIAKILTFYIPARVGADEASGAGSFVLFGMDGAAGLTLAIARRIQALIWVAVGLAWWHVLGSRKSKEGGSCAISTVAVSN